MKREKLNELVKNLITPWRKRFPARGKEEATDEYVDKLANWVKDIPTPDVVELIVPAIIKVIEKEALDTISTELSQAIVEIGTYHLRIIQRQSTIFSDMGKIDCSLKRISNKCEILSALINEKGK